MTATNDSPVHSQHSMEASPLFAKRERVFLLLAGIFLGSLTMLNILGLSRFICFFSISPDDTGIHFDWGSFGTYSFAVAVGVLPYPITFLCTDLISEFWGQRRANWLVAVGLALNFWVVAILWLGGVLPPVPKMEPNQWVPASQDPSFAFYQIRALTFGATVASMVAYLVAQFCDVYLFHFWKRLTSGKHLWLRNNGSTLISQLVDTVTVILITHFYAGTLPPAAEGVSLSKHLLIFIATGYVFKVVVALLDTIPFYLAVGFLKEYLEFDPIAAEAHCAADAG